MGTWYYRRYSGDELPPDLNPAAEAIYVLTVADVENAVDARYGEGTWNLLTAEEKQAAVHACEDACEDGIRWTDVFDDALADCNGLPIFARG